MSSLADALAREAARRGRGQCHTGAWIKHPSPPQQLPDPSYRDPSRSLMGISGVKVRLRICSPTFDGGSAWFRDKTGAEARQGGLVYVTHGPEFSHLGVV